MATEELVARILRSNSSFTADEIASMSDSDAYQWIYENCFAGLGAQEKEALVETAKSAGLDVVTRLSVRRAQDESGRQWITLVNRSGGGEPN